VWTCTSTAHTLIKSILLFFSYAVDWDPCLGHLRVMLGKSGKTVCTLGVTSSYPGPDSLSLISVESKDQEVNLDELNVNDISFIWLQTILPTKVVIFQFSSRITLLHITLFHGFSLVYFLLLSPLFTFPSYC